MKKLILVIIIPILLICCVCEAAENKENRTDRLTEYEIKAKFIYNFTKFVTWPESVHNNESIKLCILGTDPFGSALNIVKGKKVRGSLLEFSTAGYSENINNCHILFISRSEKNNFSDILSLCKNFPVLTIADTPGFCNEGGIITLIRADNKIRFEINTDAAKQAGIKISSHLLKLARIVEPD